MSADEYVPSECEVRADFVRTHTRNFDSYLMGRSLTSEQEHYGAQFDAMIARVRRDAEAELDSWMARAYEAEGKLWKAEARIRAVRDVLDNPIHLVGWDDPLVPAAHVRRALENVRPPSA